MIAGIGAGTSCRLSEGEMVVERRLVLLGGLASAIAGSAAAQTPPSTEPAAAEGSLDLAPVKSFDELWYLLTAMNTLIFLMTVAVMKDDRLVFQSIREFQPFSSQLGDAKGVETFNAALKSSDGKARADDAKSSILEAAKEIDALLGDTVAEPIRTKLVQAFRRASGLLIAQSAGAKSWWCLVYAFRKVRC